MESFRSILFLLFIISFIFCFFYLLILFLLFINDTHKSLQNIIVELSADDTNCFISGNGFNQLERLVEVELNKL